MQSRGYRADIDGLRALAVALVVAYHAFPGALRAGFIGVDIFFVISGYLLGGVLLREIGEGNFRLTEFYARRMRRIFPALFVVLAALALWAHLFSMADLLAELGRQTAYSSAFVANLLFYGQAGYFDSSAEEKPLLHLWSLGMEEQFYLALPLLLLALRTPGRAWKGLLGLAALSLAYGAWRTPSAPAEAFYLPHARAWQPLAGVLVVILENKLRGGGRSVFRWLGAGQLAAAVILLAGLAWIRPGAGYPGLWALFPVAFAALALLLGGLGECALSRILSARPLVYLGRISYPLYLWHWPLLAIARREGAEPGALSIFGILLASLALAAATHHLVERPIRLLAPAAWLRARSTRLCAAGLALSLAFAFYGHAVAQGFLFTAKQRRQAGLASYRTYHYNEIYRAGRCYGDNLEAPAIESIARACFEPARPGADRIFLWGDSYAAHLYPGLAAVFPEAEILEISQSGCPPTFEAYQNASAKCAEMNKAALEKIIRARPRIVLLAFNWWRHVQGGRLEAVLGTLGDVVARLKEAGVEPVLLGPLPRWKVAPPNLLIGKLQAGEPLPIRHADSLDRTAFYDEKQIAAEAAGWGIRYLSLTEQLCDPSGCLTMVPGKSEVPMQWDDGHLTAEGSEWLVRSLAPRLGPGRNR